MRPDFQTLLAPPRKSFTQSVGRLVEGKALTRSTNATYNGRLSALDRSIAQHKIKEQLFVWYPSWNPFWE